MTSSCFIIDSPAMISSNGQVPSTGSRQTQLQDEVASLHRASQKGDLASVRALIQRGVPVDATTKDGWTSLLIAAGIDNAEIIKFLIESGASVDYRLPSGSTALTVACQKGHLTAARALVECGADVDTATNDAWTSLLTAAGIGYAEIIKFLIESGASVDYQLPCGSTALTVACLNGHLTAARALVECGADVETARKDGWTSLLFAARVGNVEIIKFLVESGAAVNYQNTNGSTALSVACQYGHLAVARTLLQHDAAVDAARRDGWTALFKAANQGNLEMIKLLLEAGASIDHQLPSGEAAVNLAEQGEHSAAVDLLRNWSLKTHTSTGESEQADRDTGNEQQTASDQSECDEQNGGEATCRENGLLREVVGVKRQFSGESAGDVAVKRTKRDDDSLQLVGETIAIADGSATSSHLSEKGNAPIGSSSTDSGAGPTTTWEAVESEKERFDDLFIRVARHATLRRFAWASQWQVWLRESVGRLFKPNIISEIEGMVHPPTGGNAGTGCTYQTFGEFASWVIEQYARNEDLITVHESALTVDTGRLELATKEKLVQTQTIEDPFKAWQAAVNSIESALSTLTAETQERARRLEQLKQRCSTAAHELERKHKALGQRRTGFVKAAEKCEAVAREARRRAKGLQEDRQRLLSAHLVDGLFRLCEASHNADECSDLWNTHARTASSDRKITSIEAEVVESNKVARSNEQRAMVAKYLVALWDSLLEQLNAVRAEQKELSKAATTKLQEYVDEFREETAKGSYSLKTQLLDASTEYFLASFSGQEYTRDKLDPLLLQLKEHEDRCGKSCAVVPFDEVDAGRITKLRQVLRSLKEKDQQVLEAARKLHREHFPAQKFPIEGLDEQLNTTYHSLWAQLKVSVKTDGEPSGSVVVEGETSVPTVAAPNGEGGLDARAAADYDAASISEEEKEGFDEPDTLAIDYLHPPQDEARPTRSHNAL